METKVNFFHLPNDIVIPLVLKSGVCSIVSSLFKGMKNNESFRLQMMGDFEFGGIHRFIAPPKDDHCSKNALVPVRDVIQRFRSAVWQVRKDDEGITVDEILDGLEVGTYRNQHFQSQTDILKGCDGCKSVKLYRFPEDFQQMLIDGGLDPLSEHRNKSTDKPELTPAQETRVRALYADDIALRLKLDT
jgi:hypothetical protein